VVTIRGTPKWLTIMVPPCGAFLDGPLAVVGGVSILGTGLLTVPTTNRSDCAVHATNVGTPYAERIEVYTNAPLQVTGPGECGVAIVGKFLSHHVSAGANLARITGTVLPFYALAAANVAGSLETDEHITVIILEIDPLVRFHTPQVVQTVNLSRILGVFGTSYEIAYYHDGTTSLPTTWFEDLIDNHTYAIAIYAITVYVALFRISAVKHVLTPKAKVL
jgi:hypothetical protein